MQPSTERVSTILRQMRKTLIALMVTNAAKGFSMNRQLRTILLLTLMLGALPRVQADDDAQTALAPYRQRFQGLFGYGNATVEVFVSVNVNGLPDSGNWTHRSIFLTYWIPHTLQGDTDGLRVCNVRHPPNYADYGGRIFIVYFPEGLPKQSGYAIFYPDTVCTGILAQKRLNIHLYIFLIS